MPNPTFNKYRSSTIYGNLSVRDLTNPAGTVVVEEASVDLSGNFLCRGDAVFGKGFSQNGSDTNQLDNLTLGGNGGSSAGLELSYDAGITQSGTATNTLKNLTLENGLTQTGSGTNTLLDLTLTGQLTQTGTATNTFNGFTIFNEEVDFLQRISQDFASRATYTNKFIRSIFQEQTELYSITDVKNSNSATSLRVAQGDYPYLPLNSPYTTPQVFTIAAQQTIAGSQLTINQATTTATNTANYTIANTIISNFTIPTNFSKNITLNIPISLRNTGTWTLSGTGLNATITNTINSMTATIYLNGVSWGPATITALNSNLLTRATTIAFTTSGAKTIALDQYFFNININTPQFFTYTSMIRDNSISNVVQVLLSMNITNTIQKNTNTGNFTATNTLTLVSNTSTQTITDTGTTTNRTISYNPNANGSNYAVATSTSNYLDPTLTTGGTTYTNHLRANTFNLLPEGMIVPYTGSTAPYGWLLCDGDVYNAQTNPQYQALFNVIGIQFGGNNNTDFQVPDYRGAFLRGAGTSAVVGYTTYAGQTINTPASHATQTHTHTINHNHEDGNGPRHKFRVRSDGLSGVGFDIICSFPTNTAFTATGLTVPTHSGSSGNNTGTSNANETRPFNYSVNYLIKY